MFSLSHLFGGSPKNSPVSPIAVSYVGLQHYLQLFNKTLYAIDESPNKDALQIRRTASILKSMGVPEAAHLQDKDTIWTDLGVAENDYNDQFFYGSYNRPSRNGQSRDEYLVIGSTSELAIEETQTQQIIPHFLMLGVLRHNTEGQAVHPIALASRSRLASDGLTEFVSDGVSDPSVVQFHMGYATIPLQFIVAGEKFDHGEAARQINEASPISLFQKLHFLMAHRTPSFFADEMAEFTAQLRPSGRELRP